MPKKKPQWKDVTSYSQNDTHRIPASWELKVGSLSIIVTRYIHYNPDDWLLHCGEVFDRKLLKSKDIEAAKQEAIKLVYEYFAETTKKLNAMCG
jgi:hypothetical protein